MQLSQLTFLSESNPTTKKRLKERLEFALNKDKLFKAIDSDPALIGAGVVFIDNRGVAVTLREFEPLCFTRPVRVILREPPREMSGLDYVSEVKTKSTESNLVAEAAGMTLSCGAAVLGWVVVWTSGAAIPFSGGGSSIFTVMAYSAATASSVQCMNGMGRTASEVYAPEVNDKLDSEEWYQHATLALDAISLGGATATGLITMRGIKLLNSSGVTLRQTLNGLNRQQRRRLSREIARSNAAGISNGTLKFMERVGKIQKRYSNEAIRTTTIRQMKDALGAGMSVGGSALGGVISKVAIAVSREEK
ncbi:hypothetical protein DES49_0540 [Halospina denitrificans]|uniref:NAD synthetase n=1 Tax=Halospina denitrificans TaxID=332522 RepID=A0A4R7K2Y9_9GAMM|nr:NAD synthetase [Halospina denitrificans]TDT44437.1 hypothetical protein DES49_0540 [Halospina denitrificans]